MTRETPPAILITDDLQSEDTASKRRTQAVRAYGARIAGLLNAPIELMHADAPGLIPALATFDQQLLGKHTRSKRNELDRAAKKVGATPLWLEGQPAHKVLELTSERGRYEMVVLGTHGRKGLMRLLLGSVAEEVLRGSSIPVMTVGPGTQGASAPKPASRVSRRPPRILVPTLLGPNSVAAEKYALSLSLRTGAPITLVHALRDAFHPVIQTALVSPSGAKRLAKVIDQAREEACARLADRVNFFAAQGVSCDSVMDERPGDAAEVVLKEQRRAGYDWIVLGTHGRNVAMGAFFGSTARKVVLQARIPVITVRSYA